MSGVDVLVEVRIPFKIDVSIGVSVGLWGWICDNSEICILQQLYSGPFMKIPKIMSIL